MLSTQIMPKDNMMPTGGVWSEFDQPEQLLSGILGTYTNMESFKQQTRLPYCLGEFCTSPDEMDDGEYFDDDDSVENGFVTHIDLHNDDQEEIKETILEDLAAMNFPEKTGIELEASANVLISAKPSPAKWQQKKARNQKITSQKGKQNQRKKYTLPPVEEPKLEDAPPKRVSKTVIYAVPCGAFKLRSGQTHGKALKPSRILLDQVREQERQKKRSGKHHVSNKRSVPEMKFPEDESPIAEDSQNSPSDFNREHNGQDQQCSLEFSRTPSTQHSESSPQPADPEDSQLPLGDQFPGSPDMTPRLLSNYCVMQPVGEPMLEEDIPQDKQEFDFAAFLNVHDSTNSQQTNQEQSQVEMVADPLLD